jgi:ribosomal protein S18 acetylase RimI-like enzyme
MFDKNATRIMPLMPSDHEAWGSLWLAYLDFYQASVSEDVTGLTWSRLLSPAEPVEAALAWRGSEAVGLVHHVRHRSTWTVGDYCYLQDLFVAPELRGQGIGRELIEYVYAAAKAQGCPRVYWLTHESNTDAIALYDKLASRSGFLQYRKQIS